MLLKRFIIGLSATLALAAPASAATLVNGSFNGTLGQGVVPTGWQITNQTPDTNNVNTNSIGVGGGNYFTAPNDSNDGGTWVGIAYTSTTGEFETIGQTISDFVVGQTYTLGFEFGNFGIANAFNFNNSNSVTASLDGVVIGTTADVFVLSPEWNTYSVDFVAASTSALLGFSLTKDFRSYLQIDGVTLTTAGTTIQPVPLPGGLIFMLTALGGLTFVRRRSQG